VSNASRFAHLHLHTQYSILDGAISIEKLMERCAAKGMPAVAMTDHGNMFGAVEFQEAARRVGIKPILGCELYVASGSRFEKDASTGGVQGINHMILLAMNAAGYRNLVRLVTKGFMEGFYYKPRVDIELLEQHSEGLIATSGCLSGAIPSAISSGKIDRAWELVERYSRIFPDRFYLELQRHGIPAQEDVNRELFAMRRDLNLPLLATNDCHYLECSDAHPHEALLCVQTGTNLSDPNRFRFDGKGFFVKDADEMLEVFHDCPEAVTNSIEVAERCNFELETGKAFLPDFEVPGDETAAGYLQRLSEEGLRARLGMDPAEPFEAKHEHYKKRLDYELDVITEKGYPGYFLIVWDMIRFAREQKIPVGPGRGSSAGSLAGYALGIVDIDPVDLGIPFERFLNPERASLPDIDMDFCMNRRSEVIRYVEQKYNGPGDEGRRVAGIVTFGTMQARAAVRDCGRVLGMQFSDVDKIAKLIPDTLGISLTESLKDSRELRELFDSDAQVREVVELALSLEGQIRNAGRHAAGVVISSKPILEVAPLYRDSRSKEVVVQYDWRMCEKVGLVKFDLLGLRTLTIIQDVVDRVRARQDPEFDISKSDLEDPLTYDQLCAGDTFGVFQLESAGCTDLVVKFRPRSFRDLMPLVALYRPATLQAGVHEDFVERRHGRQEIEYLLPELEEVLAETYGVILYQDQVLQVSNRIAGYSLGKGDILRKAMGKKIPAEMAAQRSEFVDGAVANGHPRAKAEELFELIDKFSGYGFPKAHAGAYALITHQTAYLKAHYPAEFYAATMTIEGRESEKLDRYMKDAAKRDIRMVAPHVNESEAEFVVTADGRAIRFGMAGVKNVGIGAVEAILEARKDGAFLGLYDFCGRVDMKRVNRRVIESLIRCGAFDWPGLTRASLTEALPAAVEAGQRALRDREVGQGSLFGSTTEAAEPELPAIAEWPASELLAGEKEVLGFYLSGHPLEDHSQVLELFSKVQIKDLDENWRGREVRIGGLLSDLRTQKTRKGDLMARAEFEDLSGSLSVVFFPRTYDACASALRSEQVIFLSGRVQVDSDRCELVVDEVTNMSDVWGRCTRELRVSLAAAHVTRERLEQLRSILDLVPGAVPVALHLGLDEGVRAELALPHHNVAVSPDLMRRLDELFGAAVATCAT
jgi:DNA polymerase-3 subunit alpha